MRALPNRVLQVMPAPQRVMVKEAVYGGLRLIFVAPRQLLKMGVSSQNSAGDFECDRVELSRYAADAAASSNVDRVFATITLRRNILHL